MIRRTLLQVSLVSALFALANQPTEAAIGRTAGQFNVSQAGTAKYHVPLWTPPASGGIRPELALTYSHVLENGLLGMGFSVSGLSAIARCPKTLAQDGANDRVKLDITDVYCLDGVRLRLETGTYGYAGSTYRTEIESFAKIYAVGTAYGGPASLEVRKADGLIYEYGATADSFVDFGSGTARAWALNAIRDRSGNRVEFTYHEDVANGSFRPKEVNYARNVSAGISVAPYQVLFVYDPIDRPDPIFAFFPAGGVENETKRLQKIEIRYSGSPVKIYQLAYEPSGGAGSRSRLSSIQECSTSTSDCLSPTQFTWTNGIAAFQAEQNTSQAAATSPFLIDVDGDGRDDLVYTSHVTSGSGTWRIRKANSSGTFDAEINTGISNTFGWQNAMAIEWNGDGMADMLVTYSNNQWHVLQSTGSGFATPYNTTIAVSGQQFASDVNGDGRSDLVRMTTSGAASMYVRYREASNFGPESMLWSTYDSNYSFAPFFPTPPYGYRSHIRKADFDGDTKEDFICWLNYYDPESQQTALYVARCFAAGFEIINWSIDGGTDLGGNYTFADFNDDGLTDVVWTYFSGGTGILYGGSYTITTGPTVGSISQFVILDYDGDGRDDILVERAGSVPLRLYRSTGNGFTSHVDTQYTYPAATPLLVGDLNGDIYSDLVTPGTIKYRLHEPNSSDLLYSVTDGFGVSATFTYAQMTDPTVYTKGTGATYPKMDFKSARPLVKQVIATDRSGEGLSYALTYTYEAARRELTGRGFLGFAKRTEIDSRLGYNLKTEQSYLQDWPYTGMLSVQSVKQSNGNVVSELTNLWNTLSYGAGSLQRKYPYVYSTTSQDRELDNVVFRTIARVLPGTLGLAGIDSTSGLTTDVTTTTTENGSTGLYSSHYKTERTINTVFNDTANWCIGRLDATTWENDLSLGGVNPSLRALDRNWDASSCRMTSQTVEPGHATLAVTISYLYDEFGNVRRKTVSGANMPPRETNIAWGSAGRFPVTIINPLLQPTVIGYNYVLGLRTSLQDPNGEQTTWAHDPFGRVTLETRPNGATAVDLVGPGGEAPRGKYIHVAYERGADGSTYINKTFTVFDQYDRAYNTETQQPSGTGDAFSAQRRSFDARGQLSLQYTPWLLGVYPAGCWMKDYDLLGRTVADRLYSGCSGSPVRSQTYTYNGLTTSTNNFRGYSTVQYDAAWRDTARVTDAVAGNTNYAYDGFGQLTQITDAYGNVTTSGGYNVRGMKISTADADLGAWTITPNALGEVVSQTNANGQTTTFQYDLLGRMTKRGDPEGDTNWTWDSYMGATRIGYLMLATSPGYSEEFWYDSKSRISQRNITIEGISNYINYAYNPNTGFLDTLEYPASTSGYRFKLKYNYSYGELVKISRNDAPFTEYWKLNQMDARQNSLDVLFGNATQVINSFDPLTGTLETRTAGPGGSASIQSLEYDWDLNGNLSRRKDVGRNLTELLTYDSLDRLTASTLNGTTNLSVTYNLIGNIMSKSDVGSYTYHPIRKHAVITAGPENYAYDSNGNMTSRSGNAISWSSYNRPATIVGGSQSSQFNYGPDRERIKQYANYTGGTETTYYIGTLVEKLITPTRTHFRHHIASPDGIVASYVRRSDGTEDLSYFTLDHLGSVDSISNSAGTTYLSYDAFGKRRNASTWLGWPPSTDMTGVANATRHGFTEHEMLDNLVLIHMNGRVFDPNSGRFLSADPYIVGLGNSQALNRYSYVNNNPLSFADPTGFWPEDCDCRPPIPDLPAYNPGFDFFAPARPSYSHPNGPQNRFSPEVTYVNGEVDAYDNQVSVLGFSPAGRDGSGRDGAAERDLQEWICEAGVTGCGNQGLLAVLGQGERWIGGPFQGAAPPERIPGGPWKWFPDKKDSRGGKWRDESDRKRTANWDPDGHWDVDDGKGNRTRYTNRGIPTSNHKPPNGKPRLPKPIARLGRKALKGLGPIAWLIYIDQVLSDPNILREDLLCTTLNCPDADPIVEEAAKKRKEK